VQESEQELVCGSHNPGLRSFGRSSPHN
jgi:hypothetical protein